MKRSKKILITCHCILNANSKVYPLAPVGGVVTEAVAPFIESGTGLFQLPCPELTYLGLNRWGMTREQYDHPNYRSHCRRILEYPLIQIQAYVQAGYDLIGVLGMDGSPNCGVNLTCEGYSGGEIGSPEDVAKQVAALRFVQGKGIFMDELNRLLQQMGITPRFFAVDEKSLSQEERSN